MLWLVAPDGPKLVQAPVVAVEAMQAEGKFNPYTAEGPSGCRSIVASRARPGMSMHCAAARRHVEFACMS